ncbi:MAG: lipoyl(octanoyl) transferase LipB [Pseudomonadota bacterium]
MTDRSSLQPSFPNWRPEPVRWTIAEEPVPYDEAVAYMEQRVDDIIAGKATEQVWLVEHPPVYTAGTSADPADLKDPSRFPVHATRRGGQYTYHGPGQRVAYLMLDLNRRHKDVRRFVIDLENWIINALNHFGVSGVMRPGRVGVWVDRSHPGHSQEDKIAAIGIRLRRWVSYHGIALNVEPDLSHFDGITPCGIEDAGLGVTSLVDLGRPVTIEDVDGALAQSFEEIFGPVSYEGE